jgi:hypothetical protein
LIDNIERFPPLMTQHVNRAHRLPCFSPSHAYGSAQLISVTGRGKSVHYRFPLSFIVLTAIVIALRLWIDGDPMKKPVEHHSTAKETNTDVRGAIGSHQTVDLETIRLSEPARSEEPRTTGPDGKLRTDNDPTRGRSTEALAEAPQE